MEPREYVEVARASSERGEVVLRRRHDLDSPPGSTDVLELRVNGVFVMDTCETTSEEALARAALAEVTDPRSVLIGGLGLGFTAHEVLAEHRVERVVVAEIEESLVGWFRDGTVPYGRPWLADERLRVTVADVRQVVAEEPPGSFDLVLLDVDNGPDFLVHPQNSALYEDAFLTEVRTLLSAGGAVCVWSSTQSESLEAALDRVFGASATRACPVTLQGRDETYWLHSAHKPSAHRPAPDPREARP